MTATLSPLTTIVTTDLSAVTRGRSVPRKNLEKFADRGIGWVPANLSLTPFGFIASPNPWGSSGDLRILPDPQARYRTGNTGSPTPFDMNIGNIVELDGTPWIGCTRSLLIQALADLKTLTGLSLVAAFEQEFQISGGALPPAAPFSLEAARRTDGYTAQLMAAMEEAGIDPEMIIAEYGADQFEIIHAPADALTAADRCVAIREITRELTRNYGWRATFSPKTAPDVSGNGVHIHFSFVDEAGTPVTYDSDGIGNLSPVAGSFCAGILRHLPAITVLTAPSVPSYYRLTPHSWSASYTWLADKEREATLRICPVVTLGGRDPAGQFNIEYRAADAAANPYMALAAIVRAGMEGVRNGLPTPRPVNGDPTRMTEEERQALGLSRLPENLSAALRAFQDDEIVTGWFAPAVVQSFTGIKEAEIRHAAGLDPAAICALYGKLY